MSEAGAAALLGTGTAADYVGTGPAPAADMVPIESMTAEQATARLAAVKADPKWRDAFLKGDGKATGEHAALVRVIFADGGDPKIQAQAETFRQRESLVNYYRSRAAIPDAVADMVMNDTPVTAVEAERAEQEWQRLKADPAWVTKLMSGDREARTQKTLIDIIKARPVK